MVGRYPRPPARPRLAIRQTPSASVMHPLELASRLAVALCVTLLHRPHGSRIVRRPAAEVNMPALYSSCDVTAFVGVRAHKRWFVGTVSLLLSRPPVRVVHECVPLRDTELEAAQDAHTDARLLIRMWADEVRV